MKTKGKVTSFDYSRDSFINNIINFTIVVKGSFTNDQMQQIYDLQEDLLNKKYVTVETIPNEDTTNE
jgi:hypothetical protein